MGWFLIILVPVFFISHIVFYISVVDWNSAEIIVLNIFTVFLMGAVFIISFFFLIIYPTMRYTITSNALILQCGPFKDEIDFAEMINYVKTDLAYSITSTGFKLPGYTLFTVYYTDKGNVKMYSTSMLKDVILIETSSKKYGISPANEQEFVKILNERIASARNDN